MTVSEIQVGDSIRATTVGVPALAGAFCWFLVRRQKAPAKAGTPTVAERFLPIRVKHDPVPRLPRLEVGERLVHLLHRKMLDLRGYLVPGRELEHRREAGRAAGRRSRHLELAQKHRKDRQRDR